MKNFVFVALLCSLAISFSGVAKADYVSIYTASQRDAYFELADPSEWALIGTAEFDKEKAPYKGTFTITNLLDQYRADDEKVGDQQGSYTLDTYNGMGAGYANTLTGLDDYVGMVFSHNSANTASVSIPDGLINSFYLNVVTHADENSTQGTFDITITTTNGTQTIEDIVFGWVGFIMEDGAYLTGFEITQNSNPNTGFNFDFVPGDGTGDTPPREEGGSEDDPTLTPEPASLLIFGLGAAGCFPLLRRRMRKNAA